MTTTEKTKADEACDLFMFQYQKALRNENIKNKVAYALYHTWRYFDRQGKRQKRGEDK